MPVLALALGAMTLLAAAFPVPTIAVTACAAVVAVGWATRGQWRQRASQEAVAPLLALAVLAFVLFVAGGAMVLALWPMVVLIAATVAGVLVLARRSPMHAFAAGVVLLGFEGSVKILIGSEGASLPGTSRAIGALAIDVALFGSIVALLAADRLRTPRALWAAASRGERIVLGLFGAWLVASLLQIPLNEDIIGGLGGFRLFQAYTGAALAAAVIATTVRPLDRVLTAVLAIGLAVSLYAAFRVAVGPADAEEYFATSIASTIEYGGVLRAIGSFSSSIGMVSFLTPLVVVGAVAGYLRPALRRLAWSVAGLALVGVLASYGRAPLFGIVVGLLFALAVLAATGDLTRRRKLVAAALVAVTVGAALGGVYVASRGKEQLRERAGGLANPTADRSVQMRFDTWRKLVGTVDDHPFGQGIGSVGGASASERSQVVTADNSYLKVLVEQGIPGALLFLAAIFGAVVVLARRLTRVGAEARATGLAALSGFVSFLALSTGGEYVEQPGKVVAWSLLGIAAAAALDPVTALDESA